MNSIDKKKVGNSSRLKNILTYFAFPLILVVVLNKYLFFNVNIPSASMAPTIEKGDKVFVKRLHSINSIKRGDIVVFYSDELKEILIKRVIGMPNDTIRIEVDGTVYINSNKLEEKYNTNNIIANRLNYKVPNDNYFFMGDNRSNSYDARYWDNPYISSDKIIGKASFIYSPFNRINKLE